VAYLSAAFANFEYTLAHILAEGDLVAAYLRASATHHGEFMGVPTTGRALEAVVAYHARVNNGRIVEDWDVWPFQVFLSQIGANVRGGSYGFRLNPYSFQPRKRSGFTENRVFPMHVVQFSS
jgi:SnoaL-like polyketide cyclase